VDVSPRAAAHHREDRTPGHRPPTAFAAEVTRIVAATVPGEVLTYGDVAAEAGSPGAARAVGNVLRGSEGLPWWRVVRADGRLVPGAQDAQRCLLAAEGVPVEDGRVLW
jgi:methylated-DNA-protein-cysteine methyltransferase related protein